MSFENFLKNMPEFETERLILRKLSFDDLDDVYEFCSNPNVAGPMTWETNKTKETTLQFLEAVINGYAHGETGEWGIVWKESKKVIGVAAIIEWSNKHQSIEVGYFLSEQYWEKGIVTEALDKIIEYGFTELSANRIEGRCDIDNIGSQKVMKKLGMRYEGTLRQNEFIKGEFRDTQFYSILFNSC
ncbi:GNAT family N-acetyltransferase [Paraliobacillus salinarum]|uniref:GNAT family N-acetyltransferase n=1 Tax=Paraliobacillus salinarum TaxID=1158996 RepID=UPI0015F772CF|nr:GNAT family protein [Paraliobacillus salinarum]